MEMTEEAGRPVRAVFRALAFGAALIVVVVGSFPSVYFLQTRFPQVHFEVLAVLTAVALVGPLPFRPTMDPGISFWPVLVFWIAISTVFVRRELRHLDEERGFPDQRTAKLDRNIFERTRATIWGFHSFPTRPSTGDLM